MTRIVSGMLAVMFSAFAVAQQPDSGITPGSVAQRAAGAAVADHQNSAMSGNIEVLSDTKGVDFRPYLSTVVETVRTNWYKFIPDEARAPVMKSGKVSIEFVILPDGRVAGVKLTAPSGDSGMDRAAWGGLTASVPFAALPAKFKGPYLALRFTFYYNPKKTPSNDPSKNEAH
ncbi:MAG: TonB family protein [Acidobacteriota bacterium]|nr:TonB family protein [Acidobacteriota bacterium]